MNIIQFELKNVLKNKVNFIVMAILFIIILLPSFINRAEPFPKLAQFQMALENNQNAINNLKDKPAAATTVTDLQESSEYLESLIAALQVENHAEALEYEYKYELKNLEDMEAGKLVGQPIIEQEKVVAELEFLYVNNKSKVNENLLHALPLANFLKVILSGVVSSMLFLIPLSLLISNIVSYEKRKDKTNLINLFPNSLTNTAVKRYVVYLGFTIFSFLLPLIIASIIVAFRNGLGDFSYPVAYISQNSFINIMPISIFITKNIVMLFLWAILLTSISFLISLLTKNTLLNSVILLGLIFLSQYGLINTSALESVLGYLPTSYVDFQNVILGGSGYLPLASNAITFENGMLTILCFSFIVLSLSYLRLTLKKRF